MAWLWWIAVISAGYAIAVWGAGRMLYYPMRYPHGEWDVQTVIKAEDVHLEASDGVKLHAWWIAAPGSKLATLHLHGNAGNISHRSYSAQSILDGGSSVLLLDYRGYGKSLGRPTERGLWRDAEAGYEWLRGRGYDAKHIVIHGESLGTAVATHLAGNKQCAGVVLEAPFTSAKAIAAKVLPLVGPVLVWGYDSLSRIRLIHAPLFVIHGDADEVIPYESGLELFNAAEEPKRMWTIPSATHNDLHLIGRAEFAERLRAFYTSL